MAEICKSRASKTGFTDNWKHHKPNRWMKQILIVCHEKTVPKKEMMMLKMAGKKKELGLSTETVKASKKCLLV